MPLALQPHCAQHLFLPQFIQGGSISRPRDTLSVFGGQDLLQPERASRVSACRNFRPILIRPMIRYMMNCHEPEHTSKTSTKDNWARLSLIIAARSRGVLDDDRCARHGQEIFSPLMVDRHFLAAVVMGFAMAQRSSAYVATFSWVSRLNKTFLNCCTLRASESNRLL